MVLAPVDAVRQVLDAICTGRFDDAADLFGSTIAFTRHGSVPAELVVPGVPPVRQGDVPREEFVGVLGDAFGPEHPTGRVKLRVDAISTMDDGRVAVRGAIMRITSGAGYGRPVAIVLQVTDGRVTAVDSYHGGALPGDADAG